MIRIGTSGYSFQDWKGNFYPADIKTSEMLKFYSQHFQIVEINSTYYAIPKPESLKRMAEVTPPDFLFTAKAHSSMTHERKKDQSIFDQFEAAIQPLVEANKFRGILAQFPQSFRNNEEARRHLSFLKERFKNYPLIAEFRHASWLTPPVFDFLRELDIAYCAVDEPNLPGLMPPEVVATSNLGYVRFHGRNAETWYGGDSSERYNYLYTEEQLKEWAPKISNLANSTQDTFVFFNNCHAGYAARNAKTMQNILQPELFKPIGENNEKS